MKIRALLVILALAVPSGSLGQQSEPTAHAEPPATPPAVMLRGTPDLPFGAPYNVGVMAADERQQANTEVPLRDYMSSRLDQLRVELLNRIELLERQMRDIIDERDRQYAQRFGAQEAATNASLAAAKEAVAKAEAASDKRFDSQNEFRQQLDDQADTFVTKDTFEATVESIRSVLKSLEEKILNSTQRVDTMASQSEGASNTWALVAGAITFIVLVAGFLINYNRHKAAA